MNLNKLFGFSGNTKVDSAVASTTDSNNSTDKAPPNKKGGQINRLFGFRPRNATSNSVDKPQVDTSSQPTAKPAVTRDNPVDATLKKAGIDPSTLSAGVRDLFATVGGNKEVQPTTPPGKGSIQKLYDDPSFKALYDFTMRCLHSIEQSNRHWDHLAQIRNFTKAARYVLDGVALDGTGKAGQALFDRFPGTQERRALAHLLMLLMPADERREAPVLPDGGRGPAQSLFQPLPDAVIARADSKFALEQGDLPIIAPVFTRPLTAPGLLDKIFRKGQNGIFLAPKKYCPGGFVQDRLDINPPGSPKNGQVGHEGSTIFVQIKDIVVKDGRKYAKVSVCEQHRTHVKDSRIEKGAVAFGGTDVVLDTNGKPVPGPDGQPQPILVPVDEMAKYFLDPGTNHGTSGLDLQREEDRAIALTYATMLKNTPLTSSNGVTKSLFAWLETADASTPREALDRVREKARETAWQEIAKHACHPRRTHFKLELSGPQNDWAHQSYTMLNELGIMEDCGNRYEKDKVATQGMHELAWTGYFLDNGFVGGSLDCLGSAAAFNRLAATFLTPLGIINTTDIAEGHGCELHRVLSSPDENGVIQAGVLLKSKQNELILGLDVRLSAGRGPAAQYMENWPGYLKIGPASGETVDFATAVNEANKISSSLS